MKYRKGKYVYFCEEEAVDELCASRECSQCPIFTRCPLEVDCADWAEENPAEFAKLCGYDLIDEYLLEMEGERDMDGRVCNEAAVSPGD